MFGLLCLVQNARVAGVEGATVVYGFYLFRLKGNPDAMLNIVIFSSSIFDAVIT